MRVTTQKIFAGKIVTNTQVGFDNELIIKVTSDMPYLSLVLTASAVRSLEMKLLVIWILLLVKTAVSVGNEVTDEDNAFSVFSFIGSLAGGLSNLSTMMTNFKDLLQLIASDNTESLGHLSTPIPEDAYLNITRLVKKYEYPIEEHTITTEDGYVLIVHRIPRGKTGIENGRIAFLMHGILDSSDSWVLQGPHRALAYILADEGYDVWLGNARGNKYGLQHVNMSSTESDFWEFTWEEIGVYDLPAMINYTLNVTGQERLYFIGHSQGTTAFYVMCSMKPEYNSKIKLMISLAPVAWLEHSKSPLVRIFSPAYNVLGYLLSNFNTYTPSTEFFNKIISWVCSVNGRRCESSVFNFTGKSRLINATMLPLILGHMPTGSSTMQFVHYGQLFESGRFCRYDFHDERNLAYYEGGKPPDYDLSQLTVPVSLYYSANDWFSDPLDVDKLRKHLPIVYDSYFVSNFSHMDYMYAAEAKNVIYDRIVTQIDELENFIQP